MEKTLQNIPFLRITVALVAGIIIGNNTNTGILTGLILCVIIFILLIIASYNYNFSTTTFYGLGIQLLFFLIGITLCIHYNKKPEFYNQGKFIGYILETPQEKPKSYKTLIQITAISTIDSIVITNEKVIAYFEKNDESFSLNAGEIIVFDNPPQLVKNYNNPYEFDYKNYLEKKRIYRQVYLKQDKWTKTKLTHSSPGIKAEQFREKLLQLYRKQPIDETEFEILSALTLGYKREIDPETKRVFAESGASHVLAVSGLHVGIIFWLITIIIGFLRKSKKGKILFVLISISILWFYALITGLSPSVMRASLMFSIYIVGDNLQKKSNIYNSLAASAFILLLINPNNLFDVGFQLSYAAVFSIVFLQPKFEKLFPAKNKVIKFFLTLITVSIAAQISTFPLTSYYFGQFPVYFWLTNIFVIPAVMILIPTGIFLLVFSNISIVSVPVAHFLNFTTKAVYFMLSTIDRFPFSVFEIPVTQVRLILISAITIAAFLYIKHRKIYFLKTGMFFILLFFLNILLTKISRLNKNELIVYNTKDPGIHLIHGKNNYLVTEAMLNDDEKNNSPANFTRKKLGLNHTIFLTKNDTICENHILIKKQLIFFEGKSIAFNMNLNEINSDIQPDFIINPTNINPEKFNLRPETQIVTNRGFYNADPMINKQIHFTNIEGAYLIKW